MENVQGWVVQSKAQSFLSALPEQAGPVNHSVRATADSSKHPDLMCTHADDIITSTPDDSIVWQASLSVLLRIWTLCDESWMRAYELSQGLTSWDNICGSPCRSVCPYTSPRRYQFVHVLLHEVVLRQVWTSPTKHESHSITNSISCSGVSSTSPLVESAHLRKQSKFSTNFSGTKCLLVERAGSTLQMNCLAWIQHTCWNVGGIPLGAFFYTIHRQHSVSTSVNLQVWYSSNWQHRVYEPLNICIPRMCTIQHLSP